MSTKDVFRKSLPYYMERARMNQADLAKAIGMSESSVSLWLSGGAFPRINTIQKIADALGCKTDDLITEKHHPDGRTMLDFVSMTRSIDPSLVDALRRDTASPTPEEDAKMSLLWRSASLQAKRAAIAVLESMKEVNVK